MPIPAPPDPIDTKALFASRGLRCTPQRQHIYEALRVVRSHPTAEELHNLVQRGNPGTSLATVYNTLESLCRVGLVRKLAMPAGCTRYDADTREHLHVVTSDGRLLDAPEDIGRLILANLPAELFQVLERRLGTAVTHVKLQLFADARE
ncbi:MAG: transcriptional repressor [Phycisphaerales bacterium]|nr:transcriptional repressor [Phycisphaerales bacterium]